MTKIKNKKGYTLTPKFGVTRKRGGHAPTSMLGVTRKRGGHAPTSMLGVARKGGGYTLIEILIVISIIGFIVSAAMYLVTSAREEARIAGLLQFSDGIRASLSDSPVSYWSFDGGDATDSWGQNHGTVNGADCTAEGVVGNACYFDGNDEYIAIKDSSGANYPGVYKDNTAWTFAAWIKGTDGYVYSEAANNNSPPWCAFRNSSGSLSIQCINSSWNGASTASNSTSVFNGRWNHVVVTDDNGDMNIYVNGVLDKNYIYTRPTGGLGNLRKSAVGIFYRGTGPSYGGDFIGLIDEVQLYSGALSFAQIQKLYAEGAKKFQIAVK